MGYTFRPEGVVQGLQGFFLQINIAEIVIHKTDEPNAVVNFLDANGLTSTAEGPSQAQFLCYRLCTSNCTGRATEAISGS